MTAETRTLHVFLIRGLIAIAWSIVFAAASASLTTGLSAGAGILLAIYPLIDVAGTLLDARTQRGSERRVLLANSAVSLIAAVALGIAATGTVADVIAVFGAWAFVAGAAQLTVTLRRRAQFGNQWPLLLAGAFSMVAGIAYLMAAIGASPSLMPLVIYTATGGIEFVIQAWLLARRRRLSTPVLSAS